MAGKPYNAADAWHVD